MTKKMIPCRVCGKDFEPCAYCQSHADTFRWRNFACSKECAYKYIEETINYRKSLHSDNNLFEKKMDNIENFESKNTIDELDDQIIKKEQVNISKKRNRKNICSYTEMQEDSE